MATTITLTPHPVHVEGERFETDDAAVKSYDPARAPAGALPDGQDVTPEHQVVRLNADGSTDLVTVPEVRIPYWMIDNATRTYVGPASCPDCGTGLRSRGHDMICLQLPLDTSVQGDHEGCLVACGIEVTEEDDTA